MQFVIKQFVGEKLHIPSLDLKKKIKQNDFTSEKTIQFTKEQMALNVYELVHCQWILLIFSGSM